jgi:hypothetical protein
MPDAPLPSGSLAAAGPGHIRAHPSRSQGAAGPLLSGRHAAAARPAAARCHPAAAPPPHRGSRARGAPSERARSAGRPVTRGPSERGVAGSSGPEACARHPPRRSPRVRARAAHIGARFGGTGALNRQEAGRARNGGAACLRAPGRRGSGPQRDHGPEPARLSAAALRVGSWAGAPRRACPRPPPSPTVSASGGGASGPAFQTSQRSEGRPGLRRRLQRWRASCWRRRAAHRSLGIG